VIDMFSTWRPWSALVLAGALCACSGVSTTEFDCSVKGQKAFVASIMSSYYLWYDRVPPVDYAAADSPEELMQEMVYPELDHWSGIQRQQERSEFYDQGRFQGFGYTLGTDANGGLRISWVHEGSAAGRAGLDRGALIIGVNGKDIRDLSSAQLNNELSQDVVVHRIQELNGTIHDVQLQQGDVDITSVKSVTILPSARGPVGYLMFTTFVRPGEDELRAAFAQFRAAGVTQLVIDLRYNGGGLLSTAAVLGSLIDQSGADKPLIVETYNNLHQKMNRRRLMFNEAEAVDVPRVVFLTTGRTASASEQVINGLRPYLDVMVVGSQTLGKPVGADSWTHCDYAIAPITFHSLNALGQGDYFNGIEPKCEVPDDLLHELGDPEEAQLHAALRVLNDEPCFEGAEAPADDAFPGASAPNASAPAPRSSLLRPTSLPRSSPVPALPAGPLPELPGWY
jgi:C-terminal processing protease CtpA/Prc